MEPWVPDLVRGDATSGDLGATAWAVDRVLAVGFVDGNSIGGQEASGIG